MFWGTRSPVLAEPLVSGHALERDRRRDQRRRAPATATAGRETIAVPAFPGGGRDGQGRVRRSRTPARSATRSAAACARSGGSTASARCGSCFQPRRRRDERLASCRARRWRRCALPSDANLLPLGEGAPGDASAGATTSTCARWSRQRFTVARRRQQHARVEVEHAVRPARRQRQLRVRQPAERRAAAVVGACRAAATTSTSRGSARAARSGRARFLTPLRPDDLRLQPGASRPTPRAGRRGAARATRATGARSASSA